MPNHDSISRNMLREKTKAITANVSYSVVLVASIENIFSTSAILCLPKEAILGFHT